MSDPRRKAVLSALSRGEFWVRTDGQTVGATLAQRIVMHSAVDSESGCWIWQRRTVKGGYGTVKVGTKAALAHRVSFESFVGPIPDGLTIDHLCFNPPCVNPEHLRPLTLTDNCRRQRKVTAPTCANGHERTPANVVQSANGDGSTSRICRECRRIARLNFQARRIERVAAGLVPHGTRNCYEGGCRCDECRQWRHGEYLRVLAQRAS